MYSVKHITSSLHNNNNIQNIFIQAIIIKTTIITIIRNYNNTNYRNHSWTTTNSNTGIGNYENSPTDGSITTVQPITTIPTTTTIPTIASITAPTAPKLVTLKASPDPR
ncbi:hypothetical protein ACTFIV_000596 [Dictyostelium citrinum]